ncbi:MAG: apolipoprotein N-acyltransferase [Syntrophales bacterium]|nr:apolipoprotein N-acyltransferase [Syntrophales bacterium]
MIIWDKGRQWSRELGALGAGLLLFLSFPKFGFGIVSWFALVLQLRAIEGVGVRKAFWLGFLTGMIAHLGILYWIAYVVVKYGNLSLIVGIFALTLLASYLSLYTALFAASVSYAQSMKISTLFTVPIVWTSLEYIKTYALTGFPWALLGYSQYKWPVFLQIADITGVYGVSFVIALVNAFLYEFVFQRQRRVLKLAFILSILALVIAYGLWRLQDTDRKLAAAPAIEVGIVQGNVDQSVKWNPAYQDATMATYLALTREVLKNGLDLVVWPETATPFFYQDPSPYQAAMVEMVGQHKVWFLFGSPSYKRDKENQVTIFNSVYLINPQGVVQGRYDKVHLVPYGEYVPLRRFFPFINKLVHGIGDFGTGPGYIPLEMDTHKMGVLICYEAIFPEAACTYARAGSNLLVNVTNDAWFGRTSAPYQHLSMAVLRAVENKIYLVRAANTGISAFVDPVGRITGETGLFMPATLYSQVKLYRGNTFYSRYGDVFSLSCLVCVFIGLLITTRRRKVYDRRMAGFD